MTTANETSIEEQLDLYKSLVCEVTWVDRPTGERVPCGQVATHQGTGHAELEDHGNYPVLLCGRCVQIVSMSSAKCRECQVPLLTNIRAL